ncbi:MAG: hypothetical protein KME38_27145 [Spirirestis rafaelensis WJT71-NPBG6]|nr:hypothetical protein [Spirirestis rafaelensis WJT71-NPBG6]
MREIILPIDSTLRGEAGTQLILTVRRDGKTFDVPLKREAISVQAVQTLVKQEKGKIIGYIALNQFTPDAPQKTLDAVKELLSKNVDGFILDLLDILPRFLNGGF